MADEDTARMKAEEYRIRTAEISKLGENIDKLRECYHSIKIFLEAANMADFILISLIRVRPDIFGPFISDDSVTIAKENIFRICQIFELQLRVVTLNYHELKEKQDKGFDDKFAYQLWWYIYKETTTDYFKVFDGAREQFIFEILKDKTESIFEESVHLKIQKQVQKLIDNFKATEQHVIHTKETILDVIKSIPAEYEDHLCFLTANMRSAFGKYKGFHRLLFPESQDSEIKMKEKAIYALYLLPVEVKSKYCNLMLRCEEECLSKIKRLMDQFIV